MTCVVENGEQNTTTIASNAIAAEAQNATVETVMMADTAIGDESEAVAPTAVVTAVGTGAGIGLTAMIGTVDDKYSELYGILPMAWVNVAFDWSGIIM